ASGLDGEPLPGGGVWGDPAADPRWDGRTHADVWLGKRGVRREWPGMVEAPPDDSLTREQSRHARQRQSILDQVWKQIWLQRDGGARCACADDRNLGSAR